MGIIDARILNTINRAKIVLIVYLFQLQNLLTIISRKKMTIQTSFVSTKSLIIFGNYCNAWPMVHRMLKNLTTNDI